MSRLPFYFLALTSLPALAQDAGSVNANAPTTTTTVSLRSIQGNVEIQQNTWQLASPNKPITRAIRSGTGRANMQFAQGQILMGSNSLMQLKNGEPDFVTGRFFLTGESRFFINDIHYFTSGKVRIDSYENMQRIAVIDGSVRVSSVSGTTTVGSSKQYDLRQKRITAFTETDPWYQLQYAGSGDARVEATSGKVSLKTDKGVTNVIPVAFLQAGQVLSTAERSWAEVGFTGGGYLRLQPDSAISVVSVEKTTHGREVTLKLIKGSAWNVVAKNQGGYQINTPTVSTAVRGTVFRVDASGLVKVFDGKVAIPSSGDVNVSVGQQLSPTQTIEPLVKDSSDLENEQLDLQRSQDMQFAVRLLPEEQNLNLLVSSQPTTQVSATLTPANAQAQTTQRLSFSAQNGADSAQGFYLNSPLPEGRYTVKVKAQRYNQTRTTTRQVLIDRQAPMLGNLHIERVGQLLRLRGTISDLSGQVNLQLSAADKPTYKRLLSLKQQVGEGQSQSKGRSFDWVVPYPDAAASTTATPPYHLQLTLSDLAGNTSNVTF